MNDEKVILAGTVLDPESERAVTDRLIRIRGELIESVEPIPGMFSRRRNPAKSTSSMRGARS